MGHGALGGVSSPQKVLYSARCVVCASESIQYGAACAREQERGRERIRELDATEGEAEEKRKGGESERPERD